MNLILSVFKSVVGWGCIISSKHVILDIASIKFKYIAPSLVSAADHMTF